MICSVVRSGIVPERIDCQPFREGPIGLFPGGETAGWYRGPVRRVARIVAATVAALAVACEPATPALPLLTDPAEVVMAGIRSTAALHTVHARFEIGFNMPGEGGMDGQTIEIDADLDTRSFAGRGVADSANGADFTSEFIAVGGWQFTRNPPEQRWSSFQNVPAGVPFPSNDELLATISALVAGDGIAVRLADPETCGDSTCYHAIIDLDSDATWELFAPVLVGAPGNGPPPEGLAIPPVTIDLYIDQATRALIAANTAFTIQGTGLRLSIVLSNHDVPVQIVAPPPGLVDNALDNVGGRIPAATAGPPSAVESP
jgi:hypothetical protein